MPVIVMGTKLPPAQLFKRARHALGMSVEQMQDAMCIMDKTTMLRIERGAREVSGPMWVVLWHLLEEKICEVEEGIDATTPGAEEVLDLVAELEDYQKQIDLVISAIHQAAQQRRDEYEARREARREQEYAVVGREEDEQDHPRSWGC